MDNWHKTDIKLRLDLMVDGEGLLDRVVKLKMQQMKLLCWQPE